MADDGDSDEGRGAFRRRVFYIPGYDPLPPRRYRELYRREAECQAAVSGFAIAVRPRPGGGPFGWTVEALVDGRAALAEVEVLVWSDLVRASMAQGIAATYGQMARTLGLYLATGALARLMRLRKGPMLAALYPVAALIVQLLAAAALGAAAGLALAAIVPGAPGTVAGLAAAAGTGWTVLRWFKARDGRLYAHYLMHDFAWSARGGGAYPPALEARLSSFRARIRAALAGGVDEVLVVGHSSGAHLGISILADLVREGVPDGPALSLLTLGQVVPMVSFLPRADRLRADLHDLSRSDRVAWVDVTAPGDGCAFALCDPVAVSGVAPPDQRWPLVISAAFTRTLSAERWRALRWRFLRLHFQYLCAFDRPGDYDYFRVTAGPLTLGARYAGRAPSRSRITRALSGHRSRAA